MQKAHKPMSRMMYFLRVCLWCQHSAQETALPSSQKSAGVPFQGPLTPKCTHSPDFQQYVVALPKATIDLTTFTYYKESYAFVIKQIPHQLKPKRKILQVANK